MNGVIVTSTGSRRDASSNVATFTHASVPGHGSSELAGAAATSDGAALDAVDAAPSNDGPVHPAVHPAQATTNHAIRGVRAQDQPTGPGRCTHP